MNALFLLLVIFLSGCSLGKPVNTADKFIERMKTPEQINEQIKKVVEQIQNKPDWLFPADACPAEVMPDFERDINYLSEECTKSPLGCFDKCKNEDGNACYSLGLLLQEKFGREQEEAEPLFLRSCKLGIVSGCTNRAAAMFNLEKIDTEAVRCAIDTFEKTCKKNDPWGCTMYGLVLMHGAGQKKNLDEALKVLSKSCKFGIEDDACREAKALEKQILDIKKENKK